MRKNTTKAFTLIELLTVIAIIGILAAIVIPTVGAVKEKANIAASKAQISQYVNAIQLFKGEYGYFPFTDAHKRGGATIPEIGENEFIGALSGRTPDGNRLGTGGNNNYGNRRLIAFHTFSESEFLNGDSSTKKIADRFGNTEIHIAIDGDGDGEIVGLPGVDELRAQVTAYVTTPSDDPAAPAYQLYE